MPPSPEPPARRRFALTGRSAVLDPLTHAVRPDIADVRLAERVFAPHYAEAMARPVVCDCPLRATPETDSATLAVLAKGDMIDVLDISGSHAWGIATASGLVGYVDLTALDRIAS